MQTTQERHAPSPPIHTAPIVFAVALFIAVLAALLSTTYRGVPLFWDAQVNARAIHIYLAGGNPYLSGSSLNFVYSPLFLRVAALLSHLFPFHSGWYLYLTLNAAAVFCIPFLLSRYYFRSTWLTPAVAFAIFAFHPLFTAQIALLSGNISSLLYAILLATGVPGLRRNRWLLFYLVVACASLIKLPFLALLLLPLFLGDRQIVSSIVTAAVVGIEIFLENLLSPALYKSFLHTLDTQVAIRDEGGFGLFPHVLKLTQHLSLPHEKFAYLLHIAFIACLVLALWFFKKTREATLPEGVWTAAILLTAIVATPRMLSYHADVAILPAVLIAVESIRALLLRKVNPLAIALPITAFAVVLAHNPQTALFLFFLSAILCALMGIPTESQHPQPALID